MTSMVIFAARKDRVPDQTQDSPHPNIQLYFVVAEPWHQIQREYKSHRALFLLCMEVEAYEKLTYKTSLLAYPLSHMTLKIVAKLESSFTRGVPD